MAERPSDKSPDAFRTISEVADHLDLPQHVLRFWETKFPEIRPVKRAGGRRFYRPEDVDLLRAIRHLLYTDGYTIKGVQKVLKDQGMRAVQAVGADLLDGLPVEDLRQPAAKSTQKAAPKVAPPPASGAARSLLGGLLPRRREPKPDAEFFTDAEPLFAHDRPPERDSLFDPPVPRDPAPRRMPDVRTERPVQAGWDEGADMGHEDGAVAPPSGPAPRQEPHARQRPAEEPGLPFDDLSPRYDAPRHDGAYRDAAPVPAVREPVPPPRVQAPHLPPLEARQADARYSDAPYSEAPTAPPLRRPSRGPASRVAEPAPVPELEDPLLPFFDDEILESGDDTISEPLDARIRRLKEHGVEEPVLRRRVGPLTGPFEDDGPEEIEDEDTGEWGERGGAPGYAPPEPRRQGPPEQYLPPHLRSEPRMTAAPAHPPQPVLSRDDMHRLQAALYELGECRRLLTSTLDT